jgi:hypothetical protein
MVVLTRTYCLFDLRSSLASSIFLDQDLLPLTRRPFCTRLVILLTPEQRLMLKNPFIPLIFRIIVLAFSGASLGISAVLFENIQRVNNDDDPDNQCAPRASTYMAIIVGCLAIPYVLYVTWDEYMSKPYVLPSLNLSMYIR